MADKVVAESRAFDVGRVIASRTVVVRIPALCRAGRPPGFVMSQAVTELRYFNVSRIVASRTGIIGAASD